MTCRFSSKLAATLFFFFLSFPLVANAQASGTADGDITANSVTIHNNANNTNTAFLSPDGQAWFSNNTLVGSNMFSYIAQNQPEYGPGLFFGGASSNNSDVLMLYRFNRAPNVTELRVSVGDDAGNIEQCDADGKNCTTDPDTFVIGGTDWRDGSYVPRFTFSTKGFMGIGTSLPQYNLDVVGTANVTTSVTIGGAVANNATVNTANALANLTTCPTGQAITKTGAFTFACTTVSGGSSQGGTQGPAGPAGPAGTQGPKGDTGAVGPTGAQGTAGVAGPAGPVGPQGPAGAAGAAGPVGPAGLINTASCHVVKATGQAPYYVSDARCSANEIAISGGGSAANNQCPANAPDELKARIGFIHLSAPDADLKGWTIDAYSPQGEACTTAFAVCCSR